MDLPETMSGVVLIGHGGFDKLQWREDLPVPLPRADEVLIKVGASSVNNTDINTRIGWYSKSVRAGTNAAAAAGAVEGAAGAVTGDGSWSGAPLTFPRIQGADCCGRIVAVGDGISAARIGERVLVRALQTTGATGGRYDIWTFGSECDGAFAQYARTFADDALPVHSDLGDGELAALPCAYSTAEGMLDRVGLVAEDVLITGASGGVGHAAVQLARQRGARVTAVTAPDKAAAVAALGASATLARDAVPPADAFDVVVDLVAGPGWPGLIASLRRGGRYVTAGAIAGPLVELDVRTLYLRDLTLCGTTWQPAHILPNVISYVERGEIRPLVARTFALRDIRAAQQAFLDKGHVGKIVLDID